MSPAFLIHNVLLIFLAERMNGTDNRFRRTLSPVSYTHLDVYKRQKQTRLVLKNCGHIDAEHIEDAIAVGAYEAFEKAVFEMTPEAVIKLSLIHI